MYHLLHHSRSLIDNLNKKYQPNKTPFKKHEKNIAPHEVYTKLIVANRQLNKLLKQQISPDDTYQQINESLFYLQEIIKKINPNSPPLTLPAYVKNKTPSDVFEILFNTTNELNKIYAHLGILMLKLNKNNHQETEKTPSDVYELSTLILSEVRSLYDHYSLSAPYQNISYKKKQPSDVYVLVKHIEKHMEILHKYIELM